MPNRTERRKLFQRSGKTPILKKGVRAVSGRKLRIALRKVQLRNKPDQIAEIPSDLQNEPPEVKEVWLGEMDAWQMLGISFPIIRGLHKCGFKKPTPVQMQAIPMTMKTDSDIVGAAETGSGKTLAFGIPILQYVLEHNMQSSGKSEWSNLKKRKVKRENMRKTEVEHDGVVDLNMVLHFIDDGELRRGEEKEEEVVKDGVLKELDSMEDEVALQDGMVEEEEITQDDFPVDQGMEEKGTGLVAVRDNIPDAEFMKMFERKTVHNRSHDLDDKSHDPKDSDDKEIPSHGPLALILVPTRELAMQIHSHITSVAKYTNVKCCPVVGGISRAKQERLLGQSPAIVVATIGRLWMFMSEGHPYLTNFASLKFLVLDEADKMVEVGHYQDLGKITDKLSGAHGSNCRRNLVYSATLTVSRRICERRGKKYRASTCQDVMDKLMRQIGLKDDAAVIDLTRSKVTVDTLIETKVICTAEDKVVFLYYFLLLFPGRTIIFVNTIKCLLRLRSLLELLQFKPLPLHATMQQRQRLKNLDRFNADSAGLLVASDVAARGLDFMNVDHVIHFQVPMNTELYVHRSGRTARAQRQGLSVILVGPEDLKAYQNIRKTLNRDQNLKEFPVETTYLPPLRARVRLAVQLQKISSQGAKQRSKEAWLSKTARELDIDLDEEEYDTFSWKLEKQRANMPDYFLTPAMRCINFISRQVASNCKQSNMEIVRLQQLKAELAALLKKRILPPSFSRAYPTRNRDHELLTGYTGSECNQGVLPKLVMKNALAVLHRKKA